MLGIHPGFVTLSHLRVKCCANFVFFTSTLLKSKLFCGFQKCYRLFSYGNMHLGLRCPFTDIPRMIGSIIKRCIDASQYFLSRFHLEDSDRSLFLV